MRTLSSMLCAGGDIMNILELPFDVYQRYKIIQDAINILRSAGPESFRILDAGGGAGPVSGFLPNDSIRIVDQTDCDLPNFQKADVLALPFKDGAFDIALSTDVLEHVPPDRRELFLNELWRVSRHYVLLAAPFHSAAAVQAEQILFEFIRTELQQEHQFLKEHRTFGLPDRAATLGYMERLGGDVVALPNGYLSHWLPMMLITYYLDTDPLSVPLSRRLSAFYNEAHYATDNCEPAYRTLLVAAKQPLTEALRARLRQLGSPTPQPLDFSPVIPLAQLFQIEYLRKRDRSLGDPASETHTARLHSGALAGALPAHNDPIALLERQLTTQTAHLANLEDIIREKNRMHDAILAAQERQMAEVFWEKDRHVREVVKEKDRQIEEIVQARDQQIAQLVRDRDEAMAALQAQVQSLEQQLSQNAARVTQLDAMLREKDQLLEAAELEKARHTEALSQEKDRHVLEVVAEKDRQIQDIVKAHEAQVEAIVRDRDAELSARAARIAHLEDTLREKDRLRETALYEKDRHMLEVIQEKDRRIEEIIADKDQRIKEIVMAHERQTHRLCKDRDETISSMALERNALLEAKVVELDQLKKKLLEKENVVTDLNSRLEALTMELDVRARQIDHLQAFIDKIKRSFPYRLFRGLHSPHSNKI